ncbi:uncharacterized protein LOC118457885 [Anopheles albimanus]|uniref:Elongator complex protein 6 n=1 Tax=Anopheles albimanus TaxID=7167 RepID=A0A8W7JJF1_ANOAL|nr:uncharacterized protein LOC118457885 [Anopheles albimanus]XP_035775708.1 uncharacterized protein LOC118457885 [Anopheles albimanus]XP_035775709.1 uncharacterized protein LOC118457885 [Anopheles albimanus]XP_035775711.1 uncharacterized protein LOC118457885 [Anopheles albimanus]
MSRDILSACCWPMAGYPCTNPIEKPRITLVQEQIDTDGSFLIATLLTNYLKLSARNHVLLFATHRNASHYASACQKLTFNTSAAIESGQLCIVDVLAELYADCNACDGGNTPAPNGNKLLQSIIERLRALSPTQDTLVIIDDLGLFTTLHPTGEDEVIDFAEELLCTAYQPVQHIVIKVNISECYRRLCAYISDLAQVNITLAPLPSGNFREVDGRMTVHRLAGTDGDLVPLREQHRTLLYKVCDRQVRTYLSGELGIKNL